VAGRDQVELLVGQHVEPGAGGAVEIEDGALVEHVEALDSDVEDESPDDHAGEGVPAGPQHGEGGSDDGDGGDGGQRVPGVAEPPGQGGGGGTGRPE
jgi:hypothetical protein